MGSSRSASHVASDGRHKLPIEGADRNADASCDRTIQAPNPNGCAQRSAQEEGDGTPQSRWRQRAWKSAEVLRNRHSGIALEGAGRSLGLLGTKPPESDGFLNGVLDGLVFRYRQHGGARGHETASAWRPLMFTRRAAASYRRGSRRARTDPATSRRDEIGGSTNSFGRRSPAAHRCRA
jgi:hypothetical protein